MVIGMTTSMVLLFGVFGVGSTEIVNEKYDAEQSRRKELREEAERADTLDELTIRLATLSAAQPPNFNAAANNCLERISLSKEILSRGPTDENMRRRAVCEGISANVNLYGLDFMENLQIQDVGANLEAAYSPYLEDKNQEVYEHARMGLLTHRSFEHIKADSDELGVLPELFSDTVGRFEESEFIASMIETHLIVLIDLKPEYATSLYSAIEENHPVDGLEPAMKSMMCNVADRLLMKENDFERKYDDRWANGQAGRRELVEMSGKLLSQKNIGNLLIRRMLLLGQWFERNAFYDDAKSVYEEILSSANAGNILSTEQDFARNSANAGVGRLRLDGSTIQYKGIDTAGQQLLEEELKKDVVVVVYWSIDSVESVSYLSKLNRSSKSLASKPITILAVCVDDELPNEINVMRKSARMRILEPKFNSGKNSLLEVCTPGDLPHVMLIAKQGKVFDLNANPTEVNNRALGLLLDRNR